jgi:predicted nucleic acid-binding protein
LGRETAEAKRKKAVEIVLAGRFGVSGQILAEFYTNVTRKISTPLSSAEAMEWIERLSLEPCVPVDAPLVKLGIAIAERYRINYWDGAILAAAEALGAEILYTEDLNHGQLYGSVRVVNPFHPD